MELEDAAPKAMIPGSFREALLLAAAQQEQIEKLALVNSVMAPKVAARSRYRAPRGATTGRDKHGKRIASTAA